MGGWGGGWGEGGNVLVLSCFCLITGLSVGHVERMSRGELTATLCVPENSGLHNHNHYQPAQRGGLANH